MRLILIAAMLALAGCCTDQINVTSCPPLSTVSSELRARLAQELQGAAPDSAVAWMSSDWLRMRDAIRACAGSIAK